jgi:hypothetical protein
LSTMGAVVGLALVGLGAAVLVAGAWHHAGLTVVGLAAYLVGFMACASHIATGPPPRR